MFISLNGLWNMKRLSENFYRKAEVPGSILNDLLTNKEIDDPFYRDNEYKTYDLFRDDYEYIRTVHIDAIFLKMNYVHLVCEGLDTLTEIFINGKILAKTNNMHRKYSFDLKSFIHEGMNEIKVVIKSPVEFIEKAWADKNDIWGVCAKDGYQYIRKAHYMFGWDWGPALPDGGIWRNIYIEAHDSGKLEDVYISQIHTSGKVDLKISSGFLMLTDERLKLSGILTNPDGIIEQKFQFMENGEAHLTVANPRLWWPAGYGDQPLYEIKVILSIDDNEIDSAEYRIGLRTLGIKREDDEWGQSFVYEINGMEIFAKGANYIPEDNILARCTRERTKELIIQAVKANFNSLRVWGGGIYPDDYFFELCDEYGLIVWQDFMFACAQYILTDDFIETVSAEIRDNIRRLRHHPSIALWCGNNEMEWLWMDTQTEGRSKAQMDEYLQLFEEIIPPIAAEEDPDRLYWPASPSSGGGFDEPNAENRGDVHYWDVWHGLKPFTEYRKFFFRFCSEFGFQSFPCLKTVESFTLPEDRNIFSYVMESHQKNRGANGKILYYLSENFKNPKDFDSLLYVSQLLQAEAIKYGVEHWRRNRGRCMGSIFWQFNDCWPVASWSSIDSFHRWKALHYFARRFYSPVLISAEENGLQVSLHLSNESLADADGEITWKLIKSDGGIIREGRKKCEIPRLSSNEEISLDFSDVLENMDERRSSVFLFDFISNGETVSGAALLFVPNKYFNYSKPVIKSIIASDSDTVSIKMTTDTYAGYVELIMTESDCVFSDNYFSLVPGEEKTIKVEGLSLHRTITAEELQNQIQIRSIADAF